MFAAGRMDGSTGARIHALTSFDDDGMQLLALEDLNQMLSMGQQGEMRVSVYVPALVKVIDRGAANPQLVLMAVRALSQIMDIEPRAGGLAVAEGVLPILCARLLSMSDLDLAEQCVKSLNILSAHHARDVLLAGGLKAVTAFFDFFPQHLQRKVADTVGLLCLDAGRQIEDAVNVLEALPGLMFCMSSSDDRILNSASQGISRLVSSYAGSQSGESSSSHSSRSSRHNPPSLESLRALQHFGSLSQTKDPALPYYDLNLETFQPKYPLQWKKHVLTLIGNENIVQRLITMAKRNPGGEDNSYLLTTLARIVRHCPHVIITVVQNGLLDVIKAKLSASGSSRSGEGLANALRLVQAMLPPVPNSHAFERNESGSLCDRDEFDASLVMSDSEREEAAQRRQQCITRLAHSAGSTQDQKMEIEEDGNNALVEEDDFWACPMCTYHNPKSASSCEICGQVSPQIAERASRMDQGKDTSSADSQTKPIKDTPMILNELLNPWIDHTLGIMSCSQVYREIPELLERIAEEILPDLTQVAAKSANPDHRTRALGALASLLYCLPRALLERVTRGFGPGGPHYVGVVHAGLQSQNPHVVSSTLRVAMVELWRLGPSAGLKREGIPQLVRGLGARFHEVAPPTSSGTYQIHDSERVQSLRRRASSWLAYYENLTESNEMTTRGAQENCDATTPLELLKDIADRLLSVNKALEVDTLSSGLERKVSISPRIATPGPESAGLDMETPPNKKRRRMTGAGSNGMRTPPPGPLGGTGSELNGSLTPTPQARRDPVGAYISALMDFNALLKTGIVASEFQQSGLAPILAGLADTQPEFIEALKVVFGDEARCSTLVRTLHDALDGAERFAVIKHGLSTNESFRALKAHSRLLVQPTEITMKRLTRALKPFVSGGEVPEDALSFAIKSDPLAKAGELETLIWTQLKVKVLELKGGLSKANPGSTGDGSVASLRAAAMATGMGMPHDSERDDSATYVAIQAGDPVYVIDCIRPGTRVVRGRDWKWGDQDGGPGRTGVVTDVRSWNGHPDSCIRVRWDANKATNVYRYNVENAFDLAFAPRMPTRKIPRSGKASEDLISQGLLPPSTDDFRRNLKRDDEIDAMDTFHRWYRATVRVVVPKKESREGAARVSFAGFSPRFDEWIPLSSSRLAPLGTRLRDDTGFALNEVDDSGVLYLAKDAEDLGVAQVVVMGAMATGGAELGDGTNKEEEEEEGGITGNMAIVAIKTLPPDVRIKCNPSNFMLVPGAPVRVRRSSEADNDDAWWDGVVLELGAKPMVLSRRASSDSVTDKSKQEEQEGQNGEQADEELESKLSDNDDAVLGSMAQNTENEASGKVLEASEPGTVFALIKRRPERKETGDEEDDDDDGDDEDNSEWVDVTTVLIEARAATSSSTSVSGIAASAKASAGHALALEASPSIQLSDPTIVGRDGRGFARIGLLGREAFVPIIVSKENTDGLVVETRFGDPALENSFAVDKRMVVPSLPRGAYCPSLQEIKAIAKAVREVEDIEAREGRFPEADHMALPAVSSTRSREPAAVDVRRRGQRMGSQALDDTLAKAEATLSSAAAREDAGEDETLDDDAVSRSPAPIPVPVVSSPALEEKAKKQRLQEKAKVLFASSSRVRTLVREYSAIEFTSELTSSSLHHSLSAAAAMSTRLTLNGNETDASESIDVSAKQDLGIPVRLCSRRTSSETLHMCVARLAARDDYEGSSMGTAVVMDYSLDFAHDHVQALYRALQSEEQPVLVSEAGLGDGSELYEMTGLATHSATGVYSSVTNFPTLAVRGAELSEAGTSWYYEVLIVSPGLAQIGWVDSEAQCDDAHGRGCGDDIHGWAFDGKRRVLWHGNSSEWGATWREGDVLGVAVRVKEDESCDILFSLNGSFESPMGAAFSDVQFSGTLRPALTFNKTFSFRLKTKDLSFSPPDSCFLPLASAIESDEDSDVEDEEVGEGDHVEGGADDTCAENPRDIVELDADMLEPESEDETLFKSIFDDADPLPPAAQVLRVLWDLNLSESAHLVNRRLTNKLVWQLQDGLAVCSGALPRWCFRAVHDFPFLFPQDTRQLLFAATGVGVSRALLRVTNEYEQEVRGSGRAQSSDAAGPGVQLKRQKVVLPRKRTLESGIRLLRRFANSKAVVTVEFSEEIGHGLGPTLEFFSIFSREMQRKDLGMWRHSNHVVVTSSAQNVETISDSVDPAEAYVYAPYGLFPSVLSSNEADKATKARIIELFRALGRLIGRALLDDRLLDLDLSELFLEKVLGSSREDSVEFCASDTDELLEDLRLIDPEFAQSLSRLKALGDEFARASAASTSSANSRRSQIMAEFDALGIDFMLPGAPDGVHIPQFDGVPVTPDNCENYVRKVCWELTQNGVTEQVKACREGLAQAVSPESLRAFTTSELRVLLGGMRDDTPWTEAQIAENLLLRDYSRDSAPIVYLLEVLSEFDKDQRRLFLRFLTGTPRLPVGGWAALRPKMSVVKKSSETPDVLPSCSTCAVVLKLPQYSSKELLRDKLLMAISEGQSFFSMD